MSVTVTKNNLELETSDEVKTLEIVKQELSLEIQKTENVVEVQNNPLTLEVQSVGAQGPQGTQGNPGTNGENGEGDKNYTETFITQSTVVVTHNLGKYPTVGVTDSANDEVEGQVTHNSVNQLTVVFSSSFSGRIVCN